MLKRASAVLIALVMLTLTGFAARPATVHAQGVNLRFEIGNATYTMNGEPQMSVDGIPPYIDNVHYRTMIPLRTVAEALGAQVGWISETRTVTIRRGDILLNMQIDSALPEGMGMPTIVAERTFVPLAYVSTQLGAVVHWDGAARAVYVSDTPIVGTPPQTAVPLPAPVPTPEPTPEPEPTPTPTPTPTPPQHINVEQFEQRLLELTNAQRRRYGLPYLTWSTELARAARSHSNDMSNNDFFGHRGSDGSSVRVRIERYSYGRWGRVSENISAGRALTPEQAVDAWMGSQEHRDNILDESITHIGIGVAYERASERGTYFTQVMAQRVDDDPIPSPAPMPTPSPIPTPSPSPEYELPYPTVSPEPGTGEEYDDNDM